MSDWILLNGAKVDRAAFEANYAKANGAAWEKVALVDDPAQHPCLICGAGEGATAAYTSSAGLLCVLCFERFIGPSTPP